MDTIGARLKAERTRQGLSQEDVAALSGVSVLTVIRIEKGASNPRLDTVRKLAKAVSVSEESLAYGPGLSEAEQEDPDLNEVAFYRATATNMAASARDMLDRLRTLEQAEGLPPKELAKVRRSIKQYETHVRKMDAFEADFLKRTGG